jgi:S-methylmethionine-dependent homocysteine/selenocysteine methylase
MTAEQAKMYHLEQVKAFALADADIITAVTMTYSDEAIGIIEAAREFKLPVVISFTVETDGRLPSGELLQEAIERTDKATDAYAEHYMINCAHPQHFLHQLENDGGWKNRIRGIRANASLKSHAELDESETLDAGDKCLLAEGYMQLFQLLPALKVIGGCCGTDHTHIEEICKTLEEHEALSV